MNTIRSLLVVSAALIATAPTVIYADSVLFFDDFNGSGLNPAFQASFPNGPLGDGGINLTYLGAPNYSFGTMDGASVIHLTDTLNNRQKRGWTTDTAFLAPNFRLEARFNVLVQSPTTSIDSFLEAWLIDAADPTKFSFAGPHGQNYGANRQFRSGGSIDGQYQVQSSSYVDNTWYRLVIEGKPGENIRASLLADDGATELVGRTLAYSASTFPNGFRIGLAQATGLPNGNYPLDVAIDWLRLTTATVPEPSAMAVGMSTLCFAPLVRCRRIRFTAG